MEKSIFRKRLESFLWRTGAMVLSLGLGFLAQNIGLLELNPTVVALLGLILGEVSKYVDTKLKIAKAAKAKLQR